MHCAQLIDACYFIMYTLYTYVIICSLCAFGTYAKTRLLFWKPFLEVVESFQVELQLCETLQKNVLSNVGILLMTEVCRHIVGHKKKKLALQTKWSCEIKLSDQQLGSTFVDMQYVA